MLLLSLAPVLALPNYAQTASEIPPQADARRIQNVQPDEMWTRVTQCVLPYYPAVALAAHIYGVVDIGLCVSPKGDVANYRLLTGHPALAGPAVSAIAQWKFQPIAGPACSRVRALLLFNPDGSTAVDLAHAILADDFGDPGLPNFLRDKGQMPDSTAVHRPRTAPECELATQP